MPISQFSDYLYDCICIYTVIYICTCTHIGITYLLFYFGLYLGCIIGLVSDIFQMLIYVISIFFLIKNCAIISFLIV